MLLLEAQLTLHEFEHHTGIEPLIYTHYVVHFDHKPQLFCIFCIRTSE